jgi:hypothetical protein
MCIPPSFAYSVRAMLSMLADQKRGGDWLTVASVSEVRGTEALGDN